jgi:sugar phosphate isomerase/epimerase
MSSEPITAPATTTTRRTFLGALGALGAGAAAAAAAAAVPRPLLAGGVENSRAHLDAVGLQLYTVRSLMAKDVDGTLATVATVGYREVEFAGYFNREPAALRGTLDRLRLRAPSCHLGLNDVEAGFDATAAAARTLGHEWLIVASVPEHFYESVASLKELAARFNAIGKRARDAGLRYGYHNHDAEFRPVQGTIPLELLLAETDPALVDFEMDAYWVTEGGSNPLALIGKFPGRFKLLHAKDAGPAPGHAMRDVGAGTINWKAILADRKKAGIAHVFVEHDNPPDPIASITASYNYLHSLSF